MYQSQTPKILESYARYQAGHSTLAFKKGGIIEYKKVSARGNTKLKKSNLIDGNSVNYCIGFKPGSAAEKSNALRF